MKEKRKKQDREDIEIANGIWCLKKAIEIVKEHSRSGAPADLASSLAPIYYKLKELGHDAWGESRPGKHKK